MSTAIPTPRTPFEKANWTPVALRVFATAKALASPDPIVGRDLLLALETGDTVASKVFKKLAITPSRTLSRTAPNALLPDGELYAEDFDVDFRRHFPRLAIMEARSMGWAYGTECLLLLLARVGVSGFELQYDHIRRAINEVMEAA
jgi:hypothetical protein